MALCGPSHMGLCRERAAAIENIKNVTIPNDAELTGPEIAVHLEILDGYWKRFQDSQRRLLLEFPDIDVIVENMTQVEQDTQKLYAHKKAALMQQHLQTTVDETIRRAPRPSEIKVSKFSGKYTDWAGWRSEFKAKVLDARLDVSDKITLLLSALTSEAATCAGRAESLDQIELDRIWAKLDRTYDNKYQQVYAHIAKIVNMPQITTPSAEQLRSMIDVVDQHLRMLKRFDIDTDQWSPIVCVLLLGKLDNETRNKWESKDSLPHMPDLPALFNYLEQRILAIRNVEMSEKRMQNTLFSTQKCNSVNWSKANTDIQKPRFQPYEQKFRPDLAKIHPNARTVNISNVPACKQCNNGMQHYLWQCAAFKQLQPAAKLRKLQQWEICEVCLIAKHKPSDCTKGTCPICKTGKHNSLICPQASLKNAAAVVNNISNILPTESQLLSDTKHITTEYFTYDHLTASLGTFLACIQYDNYTVSSPIRGLCDTGAQVNLITESCVQSMHLSREKGKVPIDGLGKTTMSTGIVHLILTHRNDVKVKIPLSAFVVPHIAANLPTCHIVSPFDDKIPIDELADPTYKVPAKIDLLIGAGSWATIITDKMLRLCHNGQSAIAQLTEFGWVICGHMFENKDACTRALHVSVTNQDAKIDQLLIKYWNADVIPKARQWTLEEKRAEDIFVNTHQRAADGRYTVHIPFKLNKQPLGDSARTAKACFLGVERRLQRDPSLLEQYKAVFNDYRSLRHMVIAPERPSNQAESYYIPHHAINVSEHHKKFRVVFNASATTTTGVSLNDQQLPGPRLQDPLNAIFLRFRLKQYGITADIKQMFRQVNIAPEHWNYQRVFFRDSPNEPLQEYVTTVICWGQTSASFNAVRAVQQCAIDGQKEFPIGSQVALNDLYYDDLLTGADNESQLLTVYKETAQLLFTGGFELAKWATNSKVVATDINVDLREEPSLPIDAGVLGMRWHTATDTLRLKYDNDISIPDELLTKRKVISATAKIYDPTGLVLPVLVIGKILQQDIWRSGVDWDQPLSKPLIAKWREYQQAIMQLSHTSIPRWLSFSPNSSVQLHIYTDASEKAMGAAAYFRISNSDGTAKVTLITARSKIAPVKRVTIPRLELMAALIGAELSQFIQSTFHLPNIVTTFWTDSTIVLHWLKRDPATCKPFIANRIISIREASEDGTWCHVQGIDNPADMLTRGVSAEQLIHSSLWWHGPPWLAGEINKWPKAPVTTLTTDLEAICNSEYKNNAEQNETETCRAKSSHIVGIIININTTPLSVSDADSRATPITSRISELSSLLRVTSYIFRFIHNIRQRAKKRIKTAKRSVGSQTLVTCDRSTITAITNVEKQKSLRYWIADAQRSYYSMELKALQENREIPRNSSLIKLRPYIDANGFLRVGGRLANANIAEETKHQFILPPQARISHLIIRDAHFSTIHGGPQLMLAHLRRSYWITRARQVVKSTVHHCPVCVRYDQALNTQLMGNLPTSRVTQAECFLHTGLDFAGPFVIKKQRGRPPNIDQCSKTPVTSTLKAWIVIFICLSTRAVHIDVVLGLTIKEFLAAFERFTMRKGRCTKLISDNGTTFVGSDKELARILATWSKALPNINLSSFGTDWEFITPSAPFKGGLWESAVKSMKRHLKRAIGVQTLTKDELYQLAVHIEGCLNSRPLWPMSDDPTDPMPLTPAHFMLGKPILPQPVAEDVVEWPANRLTVWGHRQKWQQQIWQRWHEEYLCEKQVRTKWYNIEKNLKIGDMVVVKNENTPPAIWVLGRVVKTFPDRDGLVRTAIIKTPTGELERPINKLVFLPPQQPITVDQPINGGDC